MNYDTIFHFILMGCMLITGLFILIAILRSFLGPKTTDRIIAVNMIGTFTIAIISILTVFLGEDYLADVCLIYAMISFVAVVVLTKIYTGVYRQEHSEEKEEQ